MSIDLNDLWSANQETSVIPLFCDTNVGLISECAVSPSLSVDTEGSWCGHNQVTVSIGNDFGFIDRSID